MAINVTATTAETLDANTPDAFFDITLLTPMHLPMQQTQVSISMHFLLTQHQLLNLLLLHSPRLLLAP